MVYFKFEKLKTIIMKNLNLYLLAILTIVAFSCSDDDGDGTPVAESGEITFTVDGEEKSFEGSASYSSSNNSTEISGSSISISLDDVEPGDEVTFNLQDSEDNERVEIIYNESDGNDGTAFYTNSLVSSTQGQVVITEYTESKISGEFNAELPNAFAEKINVQGSFSDLSL